VQSRRDALAEALLGLQELAERLRRECPWDRAQTELTIVPHTVEEAYEVADAAQRSDDAKLVDELGDLLFQTVFLALLLEERGAGSLEEVARTIQEKLVRRHPHVFGPDAELDSAGEVKHRWERLKADQEGRRGIFHDIPEALPSLLYAKKVQRRATTVGFDYPTAADAFADLLDEVQELRAELPAEDPAAETPPDARHEAEVGDVLFAAVNVGRRLNVDPELALRRAADRFVSRVERAEALAASDGRSFDGLDLAAQDRYFDMAKEEER
jgi:XTP/dITP diphosphohydrolase/tetrapyrrole methylase family protein/MazG family protein/ATP diphosphatase